MSALFVRKKSTIVPLFGRDGKRSRKGHCFGVVQKLSVTETEFADVQSPNLAAFDFWLVIRKRDSKQQQHTFEKRLAKLGSSKAGLRFSRQGQKMNFM